MRRKKTFLLIVGLLTVVLLGLLLSYKVVDLYFLTLTAPPHQDLDEMTLHFVLQVVRDPDDWSTNRTPKMRLLFDLTTKDYRTVTITEARIVGIEREEFEASFIDGEMKRKLHVRPNLSDAYFHGDRFPAVPADPSLLARLEVRGFFEKKSGGEKIEFERVQLYGGSHLRKWGFHTGGGWMYVLHRSRDEHPLVQAYSDEIAKRLSEEKN